jgi:hypothetical protein
VHALYPAAAISAVSSGSCNPIALSDIVEIGIARGVEIGALFLVEVLAIAPAVVLELTDRPAVIY